VRSYVDKLKQRIAATGSRLCVGLDPRPEGGAAEARDMLRAVVRETAEFAAAFKPNMAYFEAMGVPGLALLEELLGDMPEGVPVILDAKRGDIGETQKYYARAYFENWKVDAVTLSPYMGFDSIEPFLQYEGRGVYLLAVTSNAGSADLQRLALAEGGELFHQVVGFAARAREHGYPGSVGFVAGLTNLVPEVLECFGDAPLLIPGLGAQGGELSAWAAADRTAPDVINVSRGILYADPHLSYAEKARNYADRIAHHTGSHA